MQLFSIFVLSLFLTIGLVPIFKRMAFRMHLVDEPDERKVHVLPMPRSGGISMAIGAMLPVLVWVPMDSFARPLYLGTGIIVFFGMVDDIKDLRYFQKLGAQVAGALIIMLVGGLRIETLGDLLPGVSGLPLWVSLGLTLFFIVGVTNAINLADGLDGLAGGISMLSFVAMGFFAHQCENHNIAMMSFAVAGAILGFLRYNTHPAVVFMGDAGSQMLGFLGVVFALALTQSNTPYSEISPLFLIGFPILDTLAVMVERMARGGSPFKPDKNHFHHKLMTLGLYHSEAVLIIYFLQAVFICCAFVFRFYSNGLNLALFVVMAGTLVLFFEMARRKEFKFRDDQGNLLGQQSVIVQFAGSHFSIRFVFFLFRWCLVGLIFLQCLVPRQVPVYVGGIALVFGAAVWWVGRYRVGWKKEIQRLTLYCSIPFLIYGSTFAPANWFGGGIAHVSNMGYGALIFLVIGTLNLTQRQKGFQFNPLDFLVFIVIIVLPNLPALHIDLPAVKFMVAKVLILFFGFDVLLGELRETDDFLDRGLMVVFLVVGIRGLI